MSVIGHLVVCCDIQQMVLFTSLRHGIQVLGYACMHAGNLMLNVCAAVFVYQVYSIRFGRFKILNTGPHGYTM